MLDLNRTKHRAILYIPSMLMIIALLVSLVAKIFETDWIKYVLPWYYFIAVYTIIISFILLLNDTKRNKKEHNMRHNALFWWQELTDNQRKHFELKTYGYGDPFEDNTLSEKDIIDMYILWINKKLK